MTQTPLATRFDRTPAKTTRARRLRAQMTDAERKVWAILRSAALEGTAFRRQHPMGPYVLDFYAPSAGLAIEVDGGQHAVGDQAASDNERDRWLGTRGVAVIRFWNSDVLENIEGVAEVIRTSLKARRAGDPLPSSPFQGEEESGAALQQGTPPPERGRMGGGPLR